MTVCVKSV